ERDFVLACQYCDLVGAYLVEHVAGSQHPVCSYDNSLYCPPCHHVADGSVRDEADVNPVVLELKRSKPSALHHWPCFGGDYAQPLAGFLCGSYHSKCRSICNSGEGTCVAVCEHDVPVAEELGAV